MENTFWDSKYQGNNRIWGDGPSELAVLAVKYLQALGLRDNSLSVLDIGCGYGRDSVYLLKHLGCTVCGIDNSKEAIDMAIKTCPVVPGPEFRCCDFAELDNDRFDVVFISNLYHLLNIEERANLRRTIKGVLRSRGLLFLSVLSLKDPQEYGRGVPVPDEPNSFMDKVFLHFSTQDELRGEFDFIKIIELFEHEYYEPHSTGEVHHHISWVLVGEYI